MTPQDFVFDYGARMSGGTIAAMVIGLLIMVVPALYLVIRLCRRFRLEAMGFGFGLLSALVGLIFFPILISFVLDALPGAVAFLEANEAAQAVFYAAFTVLPAFLAIYFGISLTWKRAESSFAHNAFFGIVFGLTPMLTNSIPANFSYLSAAANINGGQLSGFVQNMIDAGSEAEEIQAGLDSMTSFIASGPTTFLTEPVALTLQMFFYLGICLLLGGALAKAAPKVSLYKAMLLMLLFGGVLVASQLSSSRPLVLCLYLAAALASLVFAVLDQMAYRHGDWNRFCGRPDPSVREPKPDPNEPPKKRMPKIVMPKD